MHVAVLPLSALGHRVVRCAPRVDLEAILERQHGQAVLSVDAHEQPRAVVARPLAASIVGELELRIERARARQHRDAGRIGRRNRERRDIGGEPAHRVDVDRHTRVAQRRTGRELRGPHERVEVAKLRMHLIGRDLREHAFLVARLAKRRHGREAAIQRAGCIAEHLTHAELHAVLHVVDPGQVAPVAQTVRGTGGREAAVPHREAVEIGDVQRQLRVDTLLEHCGRVHERVIGWPMRRCEPVVDGRGERPTEFVFRARVRIRYAEAVGFRRSQPLRQPHRVRCAARVGALQL